MKFFTRQWHSGDLSDREVEKLSNAYTAHLELLIPNLPVALRQLAQGVNLHDGLVRNITLDRGEDTMIIALRCGDLQSGYFDVDLVYGNVDLSKSELRDLETIAREANAEVLYDEVDAAASGRWIHRILFWPYREVCIEFGDFGLHLEPRNNREFTRGPNVYVERP